MIAQTEGKHVNLTKILKGLAGTAPKTSAELRAALGKIDTAALEATVDRLEVERRRLLLTGSDAEVAAIGAEITAANLAAERGAAAIDELARLIAEAEAREGEVAIVSLEGEAAALREEIERDRTGIDEAATKVAGLIAAVAGKIATLSRHEKQIAAARGRQVQRVPDVDQIRVKAVERVRSIPVRR